jgi:hypothetical protein
MDNMTLRYDNDILTENMLEHYTEETPTQKLRNCPAKISDNEENRRRQLLKMQILQYGQKLIITTIAMKIYN